MKKGLNHQTRMKDAVSQIIKTKPTLASNYCKIWYITTTSGIKPGFNLFNNWHKIVPSTKYACNSSSEAFTGKLKEGRRPFIHTTKVACSLAVDITKCSPRENQPKQEFVQQILGIKCFGSSASPLLLDEGSKMSPLVDGLELFRLPQSLATRSRIESIMVTRVWSSSQQTSESHRKQTLWNQYIPDLHKS